MTFMPSQQNAILEEAHKVPGAWAVFWLTFFSAVGTLSGFFRELVVAYIYGTSAAADGYAVAIQYYNIFYTLLLSGIAVLTVIPYLSRTRDNGREAAGIGAVLALSGWFAAVAVIAGLLVFVFADPITRSLLPGLNQEQFKYTSSLIRICAGGMAPLTASMILLAILQYRYRFNVEPFGRITFNACVVIAALSLSSFWGIMGVGIGILLGVVAQLILIASISLRSGLKIRHARFCVSDQVEILKMMFIPLLIFLISNFMYALMEFYFLSGLGVGRVSGVKYAHRVLSIVGGVSASIQTVYFAKAGRKNEGGNKGRLALTVKTIRLGVLVLAPLSFILFLTAEPLIRILFERGSFNAESAAVTTSAFGIYALSVMGGFLMTIVIRASLLTGVRSVGLVAVSIMFIIGLAFIAWTLPWMGYLAIPAAFALSQWAAGLAGLALLGFKLGESRQTAKITITFLVTTLMAAACALPLWLLKDHIAALFQRGMLADLVVIATMTALCMIIFYSVVWMTNVSQLRVDMSDLLRRLFPMRGKAN